MCGSSSINKYNTYLPLGISIVAEILTKFINPTKLTFSREGINII